MLPSFSTSPKKKNRRKHLLILIFTLIILHLLFNHPLGYFAGLDKWRGLTRPLWDKEPSFPEKIWRNMDPGILGINVDMEKRCKSVGWEMGEEKRRLYSLLIFNTELDLLYLRLKSQRNVVDYWIISESNYTYSGLKKRLYFKDVLERWKIEDEDFPWHRVYNTIYQPDSTYIFNAKTTKEAWENESKQRRFLFDSLTRITSPDGIKPGDLILTSDVDEIPDPASLELIKSCKGWSSPLHLLLQTNLYSFEFPLDTLTESWNSNIMIYQGHHDPPKRFGKVGKEALTQSGWHCTFCLPTLQDISQKILAYSHFDRTKSRKSMSLDWIQSSLCKGKSLFDQPWEEWKWQLWFRNSLFEPLKRDGLRGIPRWILEENEGGRFDYLLPGNCKRRA